MSISKICTGCKIDRLLDDYSIDKRAKDGRQSKCKICYKEHLRIKREDPEFNKKVAIDSRRRRYDRDIKTSEAERNARLKYKYGITKERVEQMEFYQSGRCNICGASPSETGRKLVVDHDHKLGKVRALLCNSCNTALGLMKDDVERLRRAANYIECYRAYLREEA